MTKPAVSFVLPTLVLVALVASGCASIPRPAAGQVRAGNCTVRFPILYLDMDGTTLDPDHHIRPETLQALPQFRKCGGLVGIASGRTLDQVRPYLDELKPDLPLVLYNGALTLTADGGTLIGKLSLSADAVERFLAGLVALRESHAHLRALVAQYGDGMTLASSGLDGSELILHDLGIVPGSFCPLEECVLASARRGERGMPAKLLVVVAPSQADDVRGKFSDLLGNTARALVSDPSAGVVEVVPAAANKANAIETAIQPIGYSLEDVAAFGDSQNDVEMLGRAGLGIAMGNCHPRACEAALFVTGKNDSEAIGKVVTRLLIRSTQ